MPTQDVYPSAAVRPRARVTERLRQRVARAIASGNRAVSEVAGEYGVSWPTAHKALVVAARSGCRSRRRRAGWGSMRPGSVSVRWILDGIILSGPIRGLRASSTAPGMGRIAVGVGSCPYRNLCEGVAGRAIRGVPGKMIKMLADGR